MFSGKSLGGSENVYLAYNPAPVPTTICYVLVLLNDSPSEMVSGLASKVVASLRSKRCTIASLALPIIVGTFGTPVDVLPDSSTAMENAVQAIIRMFPSEIKLIYGAVPGLLGLLALPEAPYYGPLIPSFEKRLEMLLKLEFGQLERMD